MRWLKSLALAALAGGAAVTAPIAASMAADGFSRAEWNTLLSYGVAGVLAGIAGLFVNKPQKRDSAEE